jgi:hypothetical protein
MGFDYTAFYAESNGAYALIDPGGPNRPQDRLGWFPNTIRQFDGIQWLVVIDQKNLED